MESAISTNNFGADNASDTGASQDFYQLHQWQCVQQESHLKEDICHLTEPLRQGFVSTVGLYSHTLVSLKKMQSSSGEVMTSNMTPSNPLETQDDQSLGYSVNIVTATSHLSGRHCTNSFTRSNTSTDPSSQNAELTASSLSCRSQQLSQPEDCQLENGEEHSCSKSIPGSNYDLRFIMLQGGFASTDEKALYKFHSKNNRLTQELDEMHAPSSPDGFSRNQRDSLDEDSECSTDSLETNQRPSVKEGTALDYVIASHHSDPVDAIRLRNHMSDKDFMKWKGSQMNPFNEHYRRLCTRDTYLQQLLSSVSGCRKQEIEEVLTDHASQSMEQFLLQKASMEIASGETETQSISSNSEASSSHEVDKANMEETPGIHPSLPLNEESDLAYHERCHFNPSEGALDNLKCFESEMSRATVDHEIGVHVDETKGTLYYDSGSMEIHATRLHKTDQSAVLQDLSFYEIPTPAATANDIEVSDVHLLQHNDGHAHGDISHDSGDKITDNIPSSHVRTTATSLNVSATTESCESNEIPNDQTMVTTATNTLISSVEDESSPLMASPGIDVSEVESSMEIPPKQSDLLSSSPIPTALDNQDADLRQCEENVNNVDQMEPFAEQSRLKETAVILTEYISQNGGVIESEKEVGTKLLLDSAEVVAQPDRSWVEDEETAKNIDRMEEQLGTVLHHESASVEGELYDEYSAGCSDKAPHELCTLNQDLSYCVSEYVGQKCNETHSMDEKVVISAATQEEMNSRDKAHNKLPTDEEQAVELSENGQVPLNDDHEIPAEPDNAQAERKHDIPSTAEVCADGSIVKMASSTESDPMTVTETLEQNSYVQPHEALEEPMNNQEEENENGKTPAALLEEFSTGAANDIVDVKVDHVLEGSSNMTTILNDSANHLPVEDSIIDVHAEEIPSELPLSPRDAILNEVLAPMCSSENGNGKTCEIRASETTDSMEEKSEHQSEDANKNDGRHGYSEISTEEVGAKTLITEEMVHEIPGQQHFEETCDVNLDDMKVNVGGREISDETKVVDHEIGFDKEQLYDQTHCHSPSVDKYSIKSTIINEELSFYDNKEEDQTLVLGKGLKVISSIEPSLQLEISEKNELVEVETNTTKSHEAGNSNASQIPHENSERNLIDNGNICCHGTEEDNDNTEMADTDDSEHQLIEDTSHRAMGDDYILNEEIPKPYTRHNEDRGNENQAFLRDEISSSDVQDVSSDITPHETGVANEQIYGNTRSISPSAIISIEEQLHDSCRTDDFVYQNRDSILQSKCEEAADEIVENSEGATDVSTRSESMKPDDPTVHKDSVSAIGENVQEIDNIGIEKVQEDIVQDVPMNISDRISKPLAHNENENEIGETKEETSELPLPVLDNEKAHTVPSDKDKTENTIHHASSTESEAVEFADTHALNSDELENYLKEIEEKAIADIEENIMGEVIQRDVLAKMTDLASKEVEELVCGVVESTEFENVSSSQNDFIGEERMQYEGEEQLDRVDDIHAEDGGTNRHSLSTLATATAESCESNESLVSSTTKNMDYSSLEIIEKAVTLTEDNILLEPSRSIVVKESTTGDTKRVSVGECPDDGQITLENSDENFTVQMKDDLRSFSANGVSLLGDDTAGVRENFENQKNVHEEDSDIRQDVEDKDMLADDPGKVFRVITSPEEDTEPMKSEHSQVYMGTETASSDIPSEGSQTDVRNNDLSLKVPSEIQSDLEIIQEDVEHFKSPEQDTISNNTEKELHLDPVDSSGDTTVHRDNGMQNDQFYDECVSEHRSTVHDGNRATDEHLSYYELENEEQLGDVEASPDVDDAAISKDLVVEEQCDYDIIEMQHSSVSKIGLDSSDECDKDSPMLPEISEPTDTENRMMEEKVAESNSSNEVDEVSSWELVGEQEMSQMSRCDNKMADETDHSNFDESRVLENLSISFEVSHELDVNESILPTEQPPMETSEAHVSKEEENLDLSTEQDIYHPIEEEFIFVKGMSPLSSNKELTEEYGDSERLIESDVHSTDNLDPVAMQSGTPEKTDFEFHEELQNVNKELLDSQIDQETQLAVVVQELRAMILRTANYREHWPDAETLVQDLNTSIVNVKHCISNEANVTLLEEDVTNCLELGTQLSTVFKNKILVENYLEGLIVDLDTFASSTGNAEKPSKDQQQSCLSLQTLMDKLSRIEEQCASLKSDVKSIELLSSEWNSNQINHELEELMNQINSMKNSFDSIEDLLRIIEECEDDIRNVQGALRETNSFHKLSKVEYRLSKVVDGMHIVEERLENLHSAESSIKMHLQKRVDHINDGVTKSRNSLNVRKEDLELSTEDIARAPLFRKNDLYFGLFVLLCLIVLYIVSSSFQQMWSASGGTPT